MTLTPDHFTIVTDDLALTETFYRKILSLKPGPRPNFKFPGLWLYADKAPILHVVQKDELPNPRKGVLDHMAFRGQDINSLLGKLKDNDVPYRIIRTPDPFNQWQVFFHDPNEAKVEIDFEGDEVIDAAFEG